MCLLASSIFSLATLPDRLAMTFPFINSESEWNTELRSQKILLFLIKRGLNKAG